MIKNKGRLGLLILPFLLLAPFAQAEPNVWHDEWDTSIDAPDAKVTTGTDASGNMTRDIIIPGKITIHETHNGDKVEIVTKDVSGHGAVMCAWGLYTTLRGYFDVCPSSDPGDTALKAKLDDAILRINEFIVANSNTGVTKEVLQVRMNKQVADAKEKLNTLSSDERAKMCGSGDAAKMVGRLRSSPPEKIQKNVDELLSFPRPPVLNPCL